MSYDSAEKSRTIHNKERIKKSFGLAQLFF